MVEDAYKEAISDLLFHSQDLPVLSILVYGSYARGDYKPNSDIDLLVVLDSTRYCAQDLRSLIETCESCRNRLQVCLQMDIMLDSEIELWNKGILLDGHSFTDLSFYNKDGKLIYGEDIRRRFRLPHDIETKAQIVMQIIEAEFKRWFCQNDGKSTVPQWMTGWLLTTFLSTLGIVDIPDFDETCKRIEEIPSLAASEPFQRYKAKIELTPDEFINLNRSIKKVMEGVTNDP